MNNNRNILLIFIATLAVFAISNTFLEGYLQNEKSLDYELWTKNQYLSNWDIADHAPYKYRVLFKVIVAGTHELFFAKEDNTTFYYTYMLWSLLFIYMAAIAFYYFLKELKLNNNFSLLGVLLFLTAPPVVLAYTQPAHTREDPLGYFLLCIGLIAVFRRNYSAVLIISIIGVLCRETLMLIPFVYLFFTSQSHGKRLSVAFIPFIIWVALRSFIGYEEYKLLGMGLFYNMESYIQSIYFIGLTFYILWFPFLLDMFLYEKKTPKTVQNENFDLLRKSAPWVFLLVMVTTIVGGKLSEMRLIYLIFPWVIAIALFYIRSFLPQILQLITNKRFHLFITISFVIFAVMTYVTLKNFPFGVSKFNVPYDVWAGVTFLYVFLSFITIPVIFYALRKSDLNMKQYKLN